ncbi:MAG: hypothetical protein Q9Q40_11215 [Acidobacteriota bacterium]|nr:hypothetical protein [Acidobacteriota bacterium]MDQ7086949.1 hypothetical protein [Acidobacteriota bacterium]
MDVEAVIAIARHRAEDDLEGAVAALERYRASHEPHPELLAALAELHDRRQQPQRARALRVEALPLFLRQSRVERAAALLAGDLSLGRDAGLGIEVLLTLAGALKPAGETRASARIYVQVLRVEPGRSEAIRGLLQVAEMMERDGKSREDAAGIYDFILQHCSDSSLAHFAVEGRDRLRRQPAPV